MDDQPAFEIDRFSEPTDDSVKLDGVWTTHTTTTTTTQYTNETSGAGGKRSVDWIERNTHTQQHSHTHTSTLAGLENRPG